MNNYYTHLSFYKLEQFNINTSSLATFVLVRNSLITELNRQQQSRQDKEEDDSEEEIYLYSDSDSDSEEEIWLDHCIHELKEEDIPSKDVQPTFYLYEDDDDDEEEEEENLISYYPIQYTSFPIIHV
ncbi:hypothetical protein A0J61_00946 [Choanephora cucurbitarum]|uniref:Uncharacterized protein n=1 Tax=Choanephora cucurbitarum TaxID=101091 RepID=A0A1C7NPG4_9FUNG|nr:hypothetical protein A0J61_00946 [Choanephora cucurbitarum]